jgi:hypothetical protein
MRFAGSLDGKVMNTSTKPGIGKWKRRNPERIERILPHIQPTMGALGYDDVGC